MRRHRVITQPFGKVARDPLRQTAGIDEHEGRPVRPDQLREAIIRLFPRLTRHHRLERRLG
jgi:hypothetical protein